MKLVFIIIFHMLLAQDVLAARICDDYIDDEWKNSRYSVESISFEGIVTDHKTGLIWMQCSQGLSGLDCMAGTLINSTWLEAFEYSDALNLTGFAGYNDWRLPNIEELRSLGAKNCYFPAINEFAFPNTDSFWYWSSSPYAENSDGAWIVSFGFGDGTFDSRDHDHAVRLVRSGL